MSTQQDVFVPSKRAILIARVVLLVLFSIWLIGAIYLRAQVKEARARVEQSRIEENRRQEFLRRGAQYQQDLQRRTQTPQTRNAFDGR